MLYDEYSYWKGAHFPEKILAMKNNLITAPINLHLSLTDICNNRCYYCYVKEQCNNNSTLKKEVVLKLLNDAKEMNIKAIELTGGGEPTAHPYFYEILDHMKKHQFDVGLTTNGYNIEPSKLLWLKWIRFSIDSFEPNMYKTIRHANILDIKKLTPLFNSEVIVGVSCVINKYNYLKITEFVKKAKNYGFNNAWLKPVKINGVSDIPTEKLDYINEQIDIAKTYADENFKVFSPTSEEEEKLPFARCLQQEMCSYIDADGSVYPCCSLQGMKEFAIGNLNKEAYQKIWNNKKSIAVEKCPLDCFWWEKNVFLNYLIESSPKHVNFI